MAGLRKLLTTGTILPALLLSTPIPTFAQEPSGLRAIDGSFRLAQAAPPSEEEIQRRKQKPAQQPPAAAPPPAQHQAPPAPPAQRQAPPAPAQQQPPRREAPPAPPVVHQPPAAPQAPAQVVPQHQQPPRTEAPRPAAPTIQRAAPPAAPSVEPVRPVKPAPAAEPVRPRILEAPAGATSAPVDGAPPKPQRVAPAASPTGPGTPPPTVGKPFQPMAPAGEKPAAPAAPTAPAVNHPAPPAEPAVPGAQRAMPGTASPVPGQHAPAPTGPGTPPPAGVPPVPGPAVAPHVPGAQGGPGVPPAGVAPAPGAVMPGVSPTGPGAGNQPAPGAVGQAPPPKRRDGLSPLGAAAIGLGVGVVGGALLSGGANHLDDVQRQRQEFVDGDRTYIREPGRMIVRENGRSRIVHDENDGFRDLGWDGRTEQRGSDFVSSWDRPDGSRIITVTDSEGRLLRRIRRLPDGREVVLIDNAFRPRPRNWNEEVVVLPPLPLPRERYVIDADGADETTVYDTLIAPPVERVERRYSLDEVRASPDLRNRMRSVDVNTITFDTGSWDVSSDGARRLGTIAEAILRAVKANPSEVFLIEGHTDAVGSADDNLSLSDRRAQSVGVVLTRDFGVPPENLTTQGYGEQYLKVQTEGASRENRRVTVRRITPLIQQGNAVQ